MGPLDSIVRPLDDADLTRVVGRPGVAQGQVLDLRGRVRDTLGRPYRSTSAAGMIGG